MQSCLVRCNSRRPVPVHLLCPCRGTGLSFWHCRGLQHPSSGPYCNSGPRESVGDITRLLPRSLGDETPAWYCNVSGLEPHDIMLAQLITAICSPMPAQSLNIRDILRSPAASPTKIGCKYDLSLVFLACWMLECTGSLRSHQCRLASLRDLEPDGSTRSRGCCWSL